MEALGTFTQIGVELVRTPLSGKYGVVEPPSIAVHKSNNTYLPFNNLQLLLFTVEWVSNVVYAAAHEGAHMDMPHDR